MVKAGLPALEAETSPRRLDFDAEEEKRRRGSVRPSRAHGWQAGAPGGGAYGQMDEGRDLRRAPSPVADPGPSTAGRSPKIV